MGIGLCGSTLNSPVLLSSGALLRYHILRPRRYGATRVLHGCSSPLVAWSVLQHDAASNLRSCFCLPRPLRVRSYPGPTGRVRGFLFSCSVSLAARCRLQPQVFSRCLVSLAACCRLQPQVFSSLALCRFCLADSCKTSARFTSALSVSPFVSSGQPESDKTRARSPLCCFVSPFAGSGLPESDKTRARSPLLCFCLALWRFGATRVRQDACEISVVSLAFAAGPQVLGYPAGALPWSPFASDCRHCNNLLWPG